MVLSPTFSGLVARKSSRAAATRHVAGSFLVSGTKGFAHDHPTDSAKWIVYAALEGGEAGTYTRGTGTVADGVAVIALPELFGLVTEVSGLTVQLTPRGEWRQLFIVDLSPRKLVVRKPPNAAVVRLPGTRRLAGVRRLQGGARQGHRQ